MKKLFISALVAGIVAVSFLSNAFGVIAAEQFPEPKGVIKIAAEQLPEPRGVIKG